MLPRISVYLILFKFGGRKSKTFLTLDNFPIRKVKKNCLFSFVKNYNERYFLKNLLSFSKNDCSNITGNS